MMLNKVQEMSNQGISDSNASYAVIDQSFDFFRMIFKGCATFS